jgi:Electron transfer DM13
MSKQTMRGARMLLAVVTALGLSTPVWAQQDVSGHFKGLAHETSGTAKVYPLPDGGNVLRLEDLHTSNGPDLHVYLVEGADASNDAIIKAGRFVDLGSLKGNIGNQNYELPSGLDLDRYRSVSIWCKRFGVNFAAAPLAASASEAS